MPDNYIDGDVEFQRFDRELSNEEVIADYIEGLLDEVFPGRPKE